MGYSILFSLFLLIVSVFYFCADFCRDFFYCVNKCGYESKAEHVYDKENGIGHFCIYFGKHGERAGLEGTYVEHIEADIGFCIVHNRIKYERHRAKNGERRHCPSEEALIEVVAVMRREEYAYNKL